MRFDKYLVLPFFILEAWPFLRLEFIFIDTRLEPVTLHELVMRCSPQLTGALK